LRVSVVRRFRQYLRGAASAGAQRLEERRGITLLAYCFRRCRPHASSERKTQPLAPLVLCVVINVAVVIVIVLLLLLRFFVNSAAESTQLGLDVVLREAGLDSPSG
jgi:hypothetical protein